MYELVLLEGSQHNITSTKWARQKKERKGDENGRKLLNCQTGILVTILKFNFFASAGFSDIPS